MRSPRRSTRAAARSRPWSYNQVGAAVAAVLDAVAAPVQAVVDTLAVALHAAFDAIATVAGGRGAGGAGGQ